VKQDCGKGIDMKLMYRCGKESLAVVFLADFGGGRYLEFVEALEPPKPRSKKWVLIVSSMFGCPVKCAFCDAGGDYRGRCSEGEIFEQIDYLVRLRFPELEVGVEKFKVQFARMGEPALNPAVLSVLRELPRRYRAPGLMPAVSTIAPQGSEDFFEELLEINHEIYRGRFQLQFSLHTTDAALRDRLIPAKKMDFRWIANYGKRFFIPGGRKVTLNFALAEGAKIDTKVLIEHFDPEVFLIKVTPVNPTITASVNGVVSAVTQGYKPELVKRIESEGYQVILSIGELEENRIGSNCGMLLRRFLSSRESFTKSYSYELEVL